MTTQSTPTRKSNVNAPEIEAETALLLIDLVTDFNFKDGETLWENSRPIVGPIAELKSRAKSAGLPVIFVNDNFGNWKEDFNRQVSRVMGSSDDCRELIETIRPEEDDLYVLKPQRSGFYETPLEVLLSSMNVKKLILAGVTTDICVLFTAHDAYMRGFEVSVPADCTAAVAGDHNTEALQLIERVANADISPSTSIRFDPGPDDRKNDAPRIIGVHQAPSQRQ